MTMDLNPYAIDGPLEGQRVSEIRALRIGYEIVRKNGSWVWELGITFTEMIELFFSEEIFNVRRGYSEQSKFYSIVKSGSSPKEIDTIIYQPNEARIIIHGIGTQKSYYQEDKFLIWVFMINSNEEHYSWLRDKILLLAASEQINKID